MSQYYDKRIGDIMFLVNLLICNCLPEKVRRFHYVTQVSMLDIHLSKLKQEIQKF